MHIKDVTPPGITLKDNEIFVKVREDPTDPSQSPILAAIISLPTIEGLPQNRELPLVILLHGHQSHKNAIYQPLMAEALSKQGYCVLRFDFRGQGDSSDNASVELGRTISQDLEDMNIIINYALAGELLTVVNAQITKPGTTPCGIFKSIALEMVIAHSRGVLIMFQYLVDHPEMYVPLLVNCCGRFRGEGLAERYTRAHPTWRDEGGFPSKTLRHGTVADVWVPVPEIQTTVDVKTEEFNKINDKTHVICVYGSRDGIVPPEDGESYNRLLGDRSKLWLIDGADHNFYGLSDDTNTKNLPLKRGRVNYSVEFVSKFVSYLGNQGEHAHNTSV
ncbi:hypothetical protein DAKH74_004100 [Maudiozyma humilis]|uniref:Serine aminopeptidase S33 domain-containing protein n=1 Tax=Maudiozyma humilis TaxID=51915 RepID=A0AAV5RTC8_MAUHU|nr:hypothetical protein DAKH74_004100 [Kazachstania humilis]